MFIDFALIGLVFLFSIPAITAYFAYSHGKSFWLWFMIGCFLPILANFIVIYLCRKEALKAKKRKIAELSRYEDEWMENYVTKILQAKLSDKKNMG